MNAVDARASLLNTVSAIVYLQLAAVSGLALVTMSLLVFRRWRARREESFGTEFADRIVAELLAKISGEWDIRLVPVRRGTMPYRCLRQSLFDQIQSLSGSERDYLVDRYEELGFLHEDIRLCRSRFWSRRLEGVSRLAFLNRLRLGPLFLRMQRDRNEMVAAQAAFALSRLQHPLNRIDFNALSALISRGRQSTLLQIVANWCQIHGFERVLAAALRHVDPELRHNAIFAILTVKTPESSKELVKILSVRKSLPAQLVAETIRVLREIGDPEATEAILGYAQHADELVRQRVLEFLVFAGTPSEVYLRLFERDPSPGVRRILHEAGVPNREVA